MKTSISLLPAMNSRIAEIAYRRQRLLEKIRAQRAEVTEIAKDWQTPLAAFDAGIDAVRFIRNNPGVVSGGLVALLSLRGMGMAGWVRRGWRLLYLYPAAISLGFKYLISAHRASAPVDDTNPRSLRDR